MVGAHGTSHTIQGRGWKCPSFHPSTHVTSCGCCATSVCVWPFARVSYTMVDQPHPYIHRWIDRGVNTCMDDWSSLYITHHPRQEQEVLSFHPSTHGILFRCCVASMDVIPLLGCLCNGVSTSFLYPLMDWEGGVKIYTNVWSSWYITHHQQKQRLKMSKFSFLHVHPSFGCCVASMDVITLLGCLYNGVSINLTHTAIDGLTGVSIPVWMVGAHGTSYTIQGRGWKCPSFHPYIRGTFFGMYGQYGCDPLVCLPV